MFILGKKAELTTSNDIKGVHEKKLFCNDEKHG